jgi:cytochrome c oxidase cbb3-type subunit 2
MRAQKAVGVPYSETDEEFAANEKRFGPEIATNLDIVYAEENLLRQAETGNYDGDKARLTEMDALVAYLQVLGTMVDFKSYQEGHFSEFR